MNGKLGASIFFNTERKEYEKCQVKIISFDEKDVLTLSNEKEDYVGASDGWFGGTVE